MDKRKITLSVIAVAVLLVVLVGSTYAYWTLNGAPKVSANVQVQTGGLILRLDDTEGSITTNDVIDPNHLSFSKYFSITNESNADGYAKILFKGLTNTFVTDALVYDLEEVQADKTSYATPRMIITNEVVPKVSNSNATLVDALLIEKGTLSGNTVTPNTKYYKLTVRYKYSDTVNQSEDLNKILTSGFTLEEGQSSVSMTVSFNTNDTNVSTPSNITVTKGSTYGTLPNPTKSGYKAEWYTDSLLTEKVENTSIVMKSANHTLYAKWIEKKPIACVDASGNEIACPSTWTQGDRIAIGEGTNKQYFRYLRTTSTSSNLAECGTLSSEACADTTNGDLRFLAEYNLKRTESNTASEAIASDALQDPSDASNANGVRYGASNSDYNQSYVKTYMTNYQNVLNTLIGTANAITVDLMTRPETVSLFGCPSGTSTGGCSNIPDWAHNSNYWLGSAYNDALVWFVYNDGNLNGSTYSNNSRYGVRPVITISASYFE